MTGKIQNSQIRSRHWMTADVASEGNRGFPRSLAVSEAGREDFKRLGGRGPRNCPVRKGHGLPFR